MWGDSLALHGEAEPLASVVESGAVGLDMDGLHTHGGVMGYLVLYLWITGAFVVRGSVILAGDTRPSTAVVVGLTWPVVIPIAAVSVWWSDR